MRHQPECVSARFLNQPEANACRLIGQRICGRVLGILACDSTRYNSAVADTQMSQFLNDAHNSGDR